MGALYNTFVNLKLFQNNLILINDFKNKSDNIKC